MCYPEATDDEVVRTVAAATREEVVDAVSLIDHAVELTKDEQQLLRLRQAFLAAGWTELNEE